MVWQQDDPWIPPPEILQIINENRIKKGFRPLVVNYPVSGNPTMTVDTRPMPSAPPLAMSMPPPPTPPTLSQVPTVLESSIETKPAKIGGSSMRYYRSRR